jgi:hypothetical protein
MIKRIFGGWLAEPTPAHIMVNDKLKRRIISTLLETTRREPHWTCNPATFKITAGQPHGNLIPVV